MNYDMVIMSFKHLCYFIDRTLEIYNNVRILCVAKEQCKATKYFVKRLPHEYRRKSRTIYTSDTKKFSIYILKNKICHFEDYIDDLLEKDKEGSFYIIPEEGTVLTLEHVEFLNIAIKANLDSLKDKWGLFVFYNNVKRVGARNKTRLIKNSISNKFILSDNRYSFENLLSIYHNKRYTLDDICVLMYRKGVINPEPKIRFGSRGIDSLFAHYRESKYMPLFVTDDFKTEKWR
ncbi:hypothetical protein COV24_03455 [candidate division WWE3 bacterium CG10_big_fil_rev_8_21_14_0_10_32_10]|uniref:Uncharacterized protein n=1 Tax=candidate division WWE3 bacterium CG10_big_fil_rev_8_21_14_0_10_32_10 TaxID=1975090 RepID=A0A2H0R9T5_UNCKA|nr:MAG: hypothetical protein COV24_03455 [candidate division WWE3 bacterium CG10_big_fil_rev_8_21_14_0_10_32_10]